MSEKKYNFPAGVFVKVVNTKCGNITKLSINKKKFIEYVQGIEDDDEYLKLDILKRPNPTEKQTHYVVVDDWRPSTKEKSSETIDKKIEEDLFDNVG